MTETTPQVETLKKQLSYAEEMVHSLAGILYAIETVADAGGDEEESRYTISSLASTGKKLIHFDCLEAEASEETLRHFGIIAG